MTSKLFFLEKKYPLILKNQGKVSLNFDDIFWLINPIVGQIAGVECKRPYWPYDKIILSFKGCYIPKKGDVVVGTVINKLGEFYKVSLNYSHDGILSDMAFEGATKRNKPNLIPGNYLCSRISYVDLESGEIELTCITPEEKKAWSNNENYLGVLKNSNYKNTNVIEEYSKSVRPGSSGENHSCIKDGMAVTVPQSVAQILLADQSYVLKVLSKYFAYEICVGQNGVVWFSASTTKEMLLIMSALKIIPNCTKAQAVYRVNMHSYVLVLL
ncbi:uncharacterized protein cubi_00892 [Cryptosporidium ubiquitum]|uniref:S1 motif domain-containing protein n=1 Tax=Cryptosporidium ubiquitum TaxID=857276 RepID=A0A1J4MB77_9CRYT|nr:uncharacterized protein cubi_00892 [Cryptosporidium ubiquitum]OII70747.1 hypothetical protein cubi_00892 [Cryptosporidium ubiquitum]